MIGILNIDKPSGPTSHDVVALVRRLSRQRKVGHAGTLDPMATGVLLICVGHATRVSHDLMDAPKCYRASIRLGISTNTDDAEGEPISQASVHVTPEQVKAALSRFIGRIEQTPPLYSAIKQQGRRLYELARRGIEVQAQPRQVTIHDIRVLRIDLPLVDVEVHCGSGTYIRALARDVGQALGCGGHLAALRRTQIGRFSVQDALSIEQLQDAFARGDVARFVHPIDAALQHMPAIHVGSEDAKRIAMGQAIACPQDIGQDADRARVYGPGRQFLAIALRAAPPGLWQPDRVFVQPDELETDRGQDPGDARS